MVPCSSSSLTSVVCEDHTEIYSAVVLDVQPDFPQASTHAVAVENSSFSVSNYAVLNSTVCDC